LAASRRSPEIPDSADLYGWLCGSWELDVLNYRGIDVRNRPLKGIVVPVSALFMHRRTVAIAVAAGVAKVF
jgi:hypothetical protein